MKILLDSDSLYFRPACTVDNSMQLKKAIDYNIGLIEENCWSDDFMIAIKGKGNFRKDLYPKYKANRPPIKPHVAEMLRYGIEYLVDKYDAIPADGMEADDLCAIWAQDCRDFETPYTVVGIDKDLLQIPGNHYNFVKQTHRFVDPDEADLLLMTQCLTGDTSDNIPGLRGIGPKKAEKILKGIPMERRWNRVKAAWRGHRAGNPDLSRRLLTMLTSWDELDEIQKGIQNELQTDLRQPSSESTEVKEEETDSSSPW